MTHSKCDTVFMPFRASTTLCKNGVLKPPLNPIQTGCTMRDSIQISFIPGLKSASIACPCFHLLSSRSRPEPCGQHRGRNLRLIYSADRSWIRDVACVPPRNIICGRGVHSALSSLSREQPFVAQRSNMLAPFMEWCKIYSTFPWLYLWGSFEHVIWQGWPTRGSRATCGSW